MNVKIYAHNHAYQTMCIPTCLYTYMYTHIYIYIYTHMYMHTYMYAHMYEYACLCFVVVGGGGASFLSRCHLQNTRAKGLAPHRSGKRWFVGGVLVYMYVSMSLVCVLYIYICICFPLYTHVCAYIYIERERDEHVHILMRCVCKCILTVGYAIPNICSTPKEPSDVPRSFSTTSIQTRQHIPNVHPDNKRVFQGGRGTS